VHDEAGADGGSQEVAPIQARRQAFCDDGRVTVATLERPRLRGVIHRWAAPIGVVLFVILAVRAPTAGTRIGVIVYGFCVTAMLGVSAIYHSGRLSPAAVSRLKRVDHSTILLAIAGSYTAIISLGLDGSTQRTLLIATWTAAVIGVLIRMFWLHAPYPVVATVYVVVGWMALIDVPAYTRALTNPELALVVAGGVLYTAGAVVYALHKPNPWPQTFGYHEVFHALVVLAALAHYIAIFDLAGRVS
jgi:hemolysin III